MEYLYEAGATRWLRWKGTGDVRGHVPRHGWYAQAFVLDRHPITNRPLPSNQWWITETFQGL